jgi:starch phosphorylase
MANLAIVGSHAVNGVAALHTRILQGETFPELHDFFPHKFRNVTNGVTPRRWMLQANPPLSRILDEAAGEEWPRDLNALRALEPLAGEPAFRARWMEMKSERRNHLAEALRRDLRIEVDPASLFDVQIKRIHEYKRQLMNVMHVIALYHRIAAGEEHQPPRTVIFAGKAFPGYRVAKQIIALIHAVAESVHANPHVRDLLAVHFLPNYDVSLAELLFPATDLSEQISTAGTEASGTGCMKAILNGGVIIGTLDGANVEIRDAVGEENMFIFGHTTEELDGIRAKGYEPRSWIAQSPDLPRVIDTIRTIGGGRFNEIADMLSSSDRYFNCADFDSYMETQRRAAAAWTDQEAWTRMSILNVARAGGFSADRAVGEYAERIWNATPIQVKLMEGREG